MAVSQTLGSSDIQKALFEKLHPMLEKAINERSVERQLITPKKVAIDGKYYRINHNTGGNFRLEGRPEDGYLPGASGFAGDVLSPLKLTEMRVKRRYIYTGINFTGQMNNAPRSDAGGYEKLVALAMKQTMDAVPEMFSRRLAVGQSGVVGRVASAVTGTGVITLTAANNPSTYNASTAAPWLGNRYIREGMVLDLTNGSASSWATAERTATADRALKVTAVSGDGTTPTITVSDLASSNIAAGDLLVEFGSRATTAISSQADYEDSLYNPMGIMDAIQDGVDPIYALGYYGNLAVSSEKLLQSIRIENSSVTPLTVDMINRLIEQIRIDPLGTNQDPDGLYCHPAILRKFQATAAFTTMSNFATNNPARFNNPGKGFTPTVGVKSVEVNNLGSEGSMKFFTSPFAPHYRVYAFRKSDMLMFEDRPFGVMDDDGLKLRQEVGKDNWTVIWKQYTSGVFNLFPRRNGYIVGVQGDQNTV